MLVSECSILDVGDTQIFGQHISFVATTFCLQHLSPRSGYIIKNLNFKNIKRACINFITCHFSLWRLWIKNMSHKLWVTRPMYSNGLLDSIFVILILLHLIHLVHCILSSSFEVWIKQWHWWQMLVTDVGVGCWWQKKWKCHLLRFQLLETDFNIFDVNGCMSPTFYLLLVTNISSNSPRTFEFLIVHGSCTILSDKVLASSLAL